MNFVFLINFRRENFLWFLFRRNFWFHRFVNHSIAFSKRNFSKHLIPILTVFYIINMIMNGIIIKSFLFLQRQINRCILLFDQNLVSSRLLWLLSSFVFRRFVCSILHSFIIRVITSTVIIIFIVSKNILFKITDCLTHFGWLRIRQIKQRLTKFMRHFSIIMQVEMFELMFSWISSTERNLKSVAICDVQLFPESNLI